MTTPPIISRRSENEYATPRPASAASRTEAVTAPVAPSGHTPGHAPSRPGDQRQSAADLALSWSTDPRWADVQRDYTAEDVVALRGSVREERTLARRGAEKLWDLIHTEEWVAALGAMTGNQAVQQVRAGLKAIYLSGWQVAADANLSGQTYPDQSLYPANSVPAVVRRINNATGATPARTQVPASAAP